MNFAAAQQIAKATLYEGYLLYPYRASAVKNRQRWNFGGLYPRGYSEAQHGTDAWTMQTECLVQGERPSVTVQVRFLHLLAREVGHVSAPRHEWTSHDEPQYTVVDSLEVGGRTIRTWQEAVERAVDVPEFFLLDLLDRPRQQPFALPPDREIELIDDPDGDTRAVIVHKQQAVAGAIDMAAERLADDLLKLRVVIRNDTPWPDAAAASRDEAVLRSLASTHTMLGVEKGEFVSLLDPPEPLRQFAAACHNVGTWPVLVGEAPSKQLLLSSPIILYDYPQIAPESAGDLYDGTEIDEILTLRIQSLTDEEKREMRDLDERSRAILERTESLPAEQLAKMHGAIRGLRHLQEQRT